MAINTPLFFDDSSEELVNRFERFLTGNASGYFDVHEMEKIVEFYLWSGRTKDSLKALELGKRLHPSSELIELKRAKVYLATGDVKKAYRILSNLIEENDSEITLLKLEVLIKLHRVAEAWEMSENFITQNADEVDYFALDVASLFSQEGHLEYALKILKLAAKENPINTDVLQELAYIEESMGLFDDAVKTNYEIINIDPYTEDAWYHLGQIYTSLKEYEKALEAFEFVLAINDDDNTVLFNKAFVQTAMGKWQEAIETYLTYAEQTDDKWQIWLLVADCYENIDDFSSALSYYKLSYNEQKDNFSALLGISINLLNLNLYQDVFPYINEAIELNEESFEAWAVKAEAHEALFQYEEALKDYQQAISIEPNLPDALKAIAGIYMDRLEFSMALKYYELAYGFDSTSEYIELFLAVANYYTSNYDEMIRYLELAVHRNLDAAELFLELCPGVDIKLNRSKE